jgi:transposase-like protein
VHVDPNSPGAELTKRQQEVLERLERGDQVKQIATDIGISRNAVYQHIERLRAQGAVAETYTPSGQPPRRAELAATAVAPRESAVARLRELAEAGDAGRAAYAEAIEGAIAAGDAVGLAYELGRLDALGERELPSDLIESALRRLSVLPPDPGIPE